MGTAPPPQFNDLPTPPSFIALIFVCPRIIAQLQSDQIKSVDG